MEFDEALRYLQGRLRLGVKLGNDRFCALLARLGSPQDKLRVVHVAGTKGKGSTTVMAASILQAAGYKVGAYLSPYVYDVRERIQINGEMIPREDFARWVSAIKPHVEALEATALGPTTEFELKTAIGLCWLAEQQVDYAVLEVGLGGRLDATNVVARPLVSVITNIGLDHTELLGHTLTEIAGEKAGIVKPGVSCVTGVPLDGEADAVICRVCRERDAALSHIVQGKRSGVGDTSYQTSKDGTLAIETPYRTLERLRLRLHGTFQHANAAVAVAGLDAVSEDQLPRLSDQSVRQGLESAWLPGRLEQISERPTVVVDVAHNELSAQALADALRDTFAAERRRLIFVVGLSRHHEPGPFLAPLAALEPAALIATEPTFRSRPAKDVALAARQHDIKKVETIVPVSDAARRALSLAGPDDLICVTGSFYTVGDLPPTLWTELLRERNS